MGLFIRTIGIKRAEAKITLANLAYNMNRLIFHERRAAMGWRAQKSGMPQKPLNDARNGRNCGQIWQIAPEITQIRG